MRDEFFSLFIETLGEPTSSVPVPSSVIDKFSGKLPRQLMKYWQAEGWCAHADGLFWTVNPDDYEDLLDEWLEDTPFEQIDAYHVIARSAFGHLYCCGEQRGPNMTIVGAVNGITALPKDLVGPRSEADLDLSIQTFFLSQQRSDNDLRDQSGHALFGRARKKLGVLAQNEMYGFEPAVVSGGAMVLDNLRRVDLGIHLSILRQLSAPSIPFSQFDIDKFARS